MIGSATSVLKDDFITAFENDEQFDVKSWLPKLKLPSQMDVLKLILFLRDEAGKNNHVEKIHQEYKRLLQNKNKTTPSFVKAREIFLMSETAKDEKTEKLFDIGHKDLEKKKLEQDRIKGNLGVRTEDLGFLQDQRGERKGFMGSEDIEYQRKKESQLKRRMGLRSVGSTSSQSSEMSLPEFLSSPEADPEADVQIPRNIMRSPMVTAAMDRTNTTPAQAMHLISAVFKSRIHRGETAW